MKFLITGGCGFLGSNIAQYVLHLGEELVVFDNLRRVGSEANLSWLQQSGKFTFYRNDIRNIYEIEEVVRNEKPDVIFHFAGQVAMTTSLQNPMLDFEINAKGTMNLLESVRKYSPDSIICFSSTNKVYGDLEYIDYEETATRYVAKGYETGFDELIRLDFHSPYGCSKGTADQYMLDFHRIYGLKTIVFRHSSIFGGRQFATIDQGWIGWFCQKAYEIKNQKAPGPFDIYGNGKQVRDILFADDLIQCYFKAIKNIGKTQGNFYNIGGGYQNSFSLLELFHYLEAKLAIKMEYVCNKPRISDQKVFIANIQKARQDFGWEVKISKEQGIDLMYQWVEKVNNE
ncbi:MAG TPA: GDP-mannose 4,6-dehydratase [Bacillota bacterium]|nr:GDP-mannose 4,6-dehydratase [Bacillota bacterium]